MGLDHGRIFGLILELAAGKRSPSECMGEVVALCSSLSPHASWNRFMAIDFDSDVARLRTWIPEVLSSDPVPFTIHGLWFGLCNPGDGKKVWADMKLCALSQYDPCDSDLSWTYIGKRHFPRNAHAASTALRRIYEIAYEEEAGIGNAAEWSLCLAFGAVAVRSLLRRSGSAGFGPVANRVGVAVGFDSGDRFVLGELERGGFVVSIRKA